MIYSAPFILPLNGAIIKEGAIRIQGNKIYDVGKRADIIKKYKDFEVRIRDSVIMPGLVNSHTHLELGMMRGRISCGGSFTSWLDSLIMLKRGIEYEEYLNSVRLGCRECISKGTTMVVDVSGTGASFEVLGNERNRAIIMLEFVGPNPDKAKTIFQQILDRARGFFPNERSAWGVFLHAPYSLSVDLFSRCIKFARENNVFVGCHASESEEELMMFKEKKGALYEYMDFIVKRKTSYRSLTPVQFLEKNGLLDSRMMLVNANYIEEQDLDCMKKHQVSAVICPNAHAYFGHKNFPLEQFIEHGINVCIGTESLACNDNLNLFEEMYTLKKRFPRIPCKDILEMACVGGAKAVGYGGCMGKLKRDFFADFIGVRLNHDNDCDIHDEIVNEFHEISAAVINGEEVII